MRADTTWPSDESVSTIRISQVVQRDRLGRFRGLFGVDPLGGFEVKKGRTLYMSHGQNQLFMLRMFFIVIVFGGDLIGFQLFVQSDAFGIRIYIVDAWSGATYSLKSEAVDDELVHSSLVSSGQRHCNLEWVCKIWCTYLYLNLYRPSVCWDVKY